MEESIQHKFHNINNITIEFELKYIQGDNWLHYALDIKE
jgi:hypothetical protein